MLAIQIHLVIMAASGHSHAGHTGIEHLTHVAAIAGMVLVLAGIAVDGARRQLIRRRSRHPHGGHL